MSVSLYNRISAILGRDCPALGGVSAEAISVIRELEDRLEKAQQLFTDLDDELVPLGTETLDHIGQIIHEGIDVTDSVADYPSRDSDNG